MADKKKITGRLTDILRPQPYYWLLCNGEQYARFGGDVEEPGLLVFDNLERAEAFCLTVGREAPEYQPDKVPASLMLEIMRMEYYGSRICKWFGSKLYVADVITTPEEDE
jgi:hypothetical protein